MSTIFCRHFVGSAGVNDGYRGRPFGENRGHREKAKDPPERPPWRVGESLTHTPPSAGDLVLPIRNCAIMMVHSMC